MYATVQNVYLKINGGAGGEGAPVMGSIKDNTTKRKGPGDGAKEKMRVRKIIECFSSN